MPEDNEKFWGIIAQKYDSIVDDTIGKNLRPLVREKLGREGNLGKVVEFGCGTGFFTRELSRRAESVVATDLSDEMLGRSRVGLKDYKNVTFRKEDCLKTSFPDESFDTAFMALVINVTDNPMQALCEANRILRPGGVILIANPDASQIEGADLVGSLVRFNANYGFAAEHYSKEEFERIQRSGHDISANDLGRMLREAGFEVTALEVLRDDSDPSNLALDYVRAIKTKKSTGIASVKSYGMAENVIAVKGLYKNYGKFTAVYNISFNVKKGEVFALLGPNGAGKTTIVEILELLKQPSGGMITIFDNTVLAGAEAGNVFMGADLDYTGIKDRIGAVPQNFHAFDLLTVYENIDYFARMYSKHVDIGQLLKEFGIEEKRNARFKDLSGGQKQRVGIAIALVNDPDILFLDEPTAGLDPRSRRDVWDAVKKLKARDKTVFLTTHYMDEAYYLADRICILHKGSIIARGTPEEIVNEYGGGSTLIIRGCETAALAAIASVIPDSRIEGSDIQAKLPEGEGIAYIGRAVDRIKEGGFNCKEIFVKKPTLEDAFLNLTGEKLAGGGE